jgi:hypothetical protein
VRQARNTSGVSAAKVRNALKSEGYTLASVSDYNREGIKVREGASGVRVVIDFDRPGEAGRMAEEVAGALRECGYKTSVIEGYIVKVEL